MRVLRILLRVVILTLLGAIVVVAGLALWARHELGASLPQLEGSRAIAGLTGPVLVKRDALGVPTIQGSTRGDALRALGFVHAQDRFFQMDLTRRRAAGELAELFGSVAVASDKAARMHRFRARAHDVIAQASPESRALMEAYADGVNAGLAALGARPFEYLVLRADPARWLTEDTILVIASMFFVLQDSTGTTDWRRGLMDETLAPALAEFLSAPASEWEAPVVGGPSPHPVIPGPEVIDLRAQPGRSATGQASPPDSSFTLHPSSFEDLFLGSNSWALSGAHTTSGVAIVADDMHLEIGVPNTWYRASIAWTDQRHHRVTGLTLPGAPIVVAGSNGDVAWGFTNTNGDWTDLVILEPDPANADRYLTPSGPRSFERRRERIRVKGATDQFLEVKETIWGPVVDQDRQGRSRALRWVPHTSDGLNLEWAGIETARSIEDAFAVAAVSGIPAQNLVIAEHGGRIAWTVAGRIPRRVGFDGRVPASWADGSRGWNGWLPPGEYPRIIDGAGGRIWTANQRVVGGDMERAIGNGGHDQGARAQQIRDDLARLEHATPRDMLAVQLDDRAIFLTRWRELLLRELDDAAVSQSAGRREFRRLVEHGWTGRASIDSAGYRLVKAFRSRVHALALDPLVAPMTKADPRMSPALARSQVTDGPLWALVSQQPPNLLAPPYTTWHALLVDAVDRTIAALAENGRTLASRTWGEANTTRIRHPLSAALPAFVGAWLDMPHEMLPGDSNMPRVQGPAVGASERLAVSPGREDEGYLHMPGGQSGHPLSPHYGDGFDAWARGIPTPFLPGRTVHVLSLTPAPALVPEKGVSKTLADAHR